MSKPKLKPLADQLAAKGRNGDTMLLHVNPIEVDFLRQVARTAGGDLTTNPDTGAPEAFFFVPMLAGLAGNALGMGTLGTAALSGLATTAATGDINKGLVAGLTGGALGSLGQSLQSFGQPAMEAASQGVQNVGVDALNGAAPQLGGAMPGMPATPPVDVGLDALNGAAPQLGSGDLTAFTPSASATPAGQGGTFDAVGRALKDPMGAFDHLMATNPAAMRMAGTGLAMAATMPEEAKRPERKTYSPSGLSYRTSTYTGGTPSKFGYADTKYFRDDVRKFAAGGSTGLGFNGASQSPVMARGGPAAAAAAAATLSGGNPFGNSVMATMMNKLFRSSIAPRQLGTGATPQAAPQRQYNPNAQQSPFGYANTKWFNYAGGGAVDPMAEHGDGTADQTPALIDGVQPAALGSGEYVVRADVVSGLGNGSTMAGVRALDDMQQRVLAQYRGDAGAAPSKIKPKKALPK